VFIIGGGVVQLFEPENSVRMDADFREGLEEYGQDGTMVVSEIASKAVPILHELPITFSSPPQPGHNFPFDVILALARRCWFRSLSPTFSVVNSPQ
jgi:hypothetical protein